MADRPPYQVLVSRAGQRDFGRLTPQAKDRVRMALLALADDPRGQSEKLAHEDAYRRRVGDYRIVFRLNDAGHEVLVTRIKHRREVYRL